MYDFTSKNIKREEYDFTSRYVIHVPNLTSFALLRIFKIIKKNLKKRQTFFLLRFSFKLIIKIISSL